jgi:hypothetical protein
MQSKGIDKKMATEKSTTGLENKTWTNPKIKNHKRKHEQTDQTTEHNTKFQNTCI